MLLIVLRCHPRVAWQLHLEEACRRAPLFCSYALPEGARYGAQAVECHGSAFQHQKTPRRYFRKVF